MSNDVRPLEPAKAGGMSLPGVAGGLLSTGLWIVLIWTVYVDLPRCRQHLEDFGTHPDSLTAFILRYFWLALPLIAFVAGVSVAANRSRRVLKFVLYWLPLILIVGLVLTVGRNLLQLLNNLS